MIKGKNLVKLIQREIRHAKDSHEEYYTLNLKVVSCFCQSYGRIKFFTRHQIANCYRNGSYYETEFWWNGSCLMMRDYGHRQLGEWEARSYNFGDRKAVIEAYTRLLENLQWRRKHPFSKMMEDGTWTCLWKETNND